MRHSDFERWLLFAYEDLRVAEWANQEGLYNQACFHAQQCAEKSIKALLLYHDKLPPKTHALAKLISLLPANTFGELREKILLLDRFYIPTRYPDALPGSLPDSLPSHKDAEGALETARQVYAIARKLMGLGGEP